MAHGEGAPRVDAGRDHGNNLILAVHAVEPVLVALDEELVVVVVALRRNDTVAKLPRLPRETRRLCANSGAQGCCRKLRAKATTLEADVRAFKDRKV